MADNAGFADVTSTDKKHLGLDEKGKIVRKSFHRRQDEVPTFIEVLWLLYRDPKLLLRDYFRCMFLGRGSCSDEANPTQAKAGQKESRARQG